MRMHRAFLAAVAIAALAAPAATAQTQDLRSPDTRDAAAGVTSGTGSSQDLRSPDARDAARGVVASEIATPDVSVEAPTVNVVKEDDFQWADAAIGAGIALAIVLLSGAAFAAVQHRRRGGASSLGR